MKHQDVDSDIEKAYPEAYRLARMFHELYEEYAPQFGYETKEETKEFKPSSPNGRLMAKVCHEIVTAELDREREEMINDLPVGFLRQWINEDVLKDGHPLVTDEDILRFIRLGHEATYVL